MNALKSCKELKSQLEESLELAKAIRDETKSHDPLDVNHIGKALDVVKLRIVFLEKTALAPKMPEPEKKRDAPLPEQTAPKTQPPAENAEEKKEQA